MKQSKVPPLVKNRRWARLQELIEEGDYFSQAELRMRLPLLYELYVGQYKRDGKAALSNVTISSVLMEQMDKQSYEDRLAQALTAYEANTGKKYGIVEGNQTISEADLEDNEDMLIRLAHQHFLRGEDSEFVDYESIDKNEALDDVQSLKKRDEEDAYFGQEEWSIQAQENHVHTEYTGEMDY